MIETTTTPRAQVSASAPSDPRVLSTATANPGRQYTQQDLLELFRVDNRKISGLFTNSHIRTRYLCLPEPDASGKIADETSRELWDKHREHGLRAGRAAIDLALERAGLTPQDIDYLVCVTSTGFLCPGLTAHFVKDAGFRQNVHRADVIGMGCHGGLNGMQPLINYCRLNPHHRALLVCVEICSAAYVFDMTIRTAVVNSLFGDGAAAAVFGATPGVDPKVGPGILGFESHVMPEQIDAMRFDHDGSKYSFFLDRDIPYVIGDNVEQPVFALLGRFGLKLRDIDHWVIHSGGRKVIDAIKYTLGLSAHDVRHTESVLRDYGNLSSGSFLFSYQRLIDEGVARPGEYMFMMTMGPGSTIECCLGKF